MKTRLVALLVSLSLSLAPCLAANEGEEEGDKRRAWKSTALTVSAVIVLLGLIGYAPILIRNKQLLKLKEVSDGGFVNVKGLDAHFNKEQVDTIAKWRAKGELPPTSSITGFGDLLLLAARHDDHDMVVRIGKLAAKYNTDLNVPMSSALRISIENENLDMIERLVKIYAEQDVKLFSLDFSSMLEAATKHDRIDIVEQVVKLASKKDVKLFSLDIVSMFEAAAKHDRIDMAEQVVKLASEQDVRLFWWDISFMLEAAAKFDRDDIAEQVAELARKNGIDPDNFSGYGRAWKGHQPVDDYVENPYEVLGVSEDASPEDIKQAFRKLIKKHHPDKNPGDKVAEEEAKKIISAFNKLRDIGKAR